MAHLRIIAAKGYDHYWTPAGAHTHYPAGYVGTVKAEVLAGAIKARVGVDADAEVKAAKKKSDGDGA